MVVGPSNVEEAEVAVENDEQSEKVKVWWTYPVQIRMPNSDRP
jgi:hypothetical protein